MKWCEVSTEDDMVVDREGTVWVATRGGDWRYITEDGLSWDIHETYPPEQYEPYVQLEAAARRIIARATIRNEEKR
ncbi:hypothetical protein BILLKNUCKLES_85 [Mycobacterium phage BillKnuckles]|uniref:SMP-30/Gluconolactonase/LRE-like region domain-containing protein n=1 Tax=Mycobacterium phage BillKnuckles TaxID=2902892 RepID=G8I6N2_9CAUD|nr:hypothetical protein CM11_gp85 [Mycobacterium phage BillKnuckles]AER48376.1 hypothetical protein BILLKNUCKLES_85 [Mycobacterium phage BillKnuckles]